MNEHELVAKLKTRKFWTYYYNEKISKSNVLYDI